MRNAPTAWPAVAAVPIDHAPSPSRELNGPCDHLVVRPKTHATADATCFSCLTYGASREAQNPSQERLGVSLAGGAAVDASCPSKVNERSRSDSRSGAARTDGERADLDCELCGRDWPEGWFEEIETRGGRLEVCARCAWRTRPDAQQASGGAR